MGTKDNRYNPLLALFEDYALVEKIRKRLPHLFYLAELDATRGKSKGMQVGSVRETVIIALLIYKFGKDNVITDIPITKPEIDVIVHDMPISIKTITVSGTQLGHVKAIWTVDAQKSLDFVKNHRPNTHILLIQINYGGMGNFILIPKSVQLEILDKLGYNEYFKLPKPNTNPRGIEFSKQAMTELLYHTDTKKFAIEWTRPSMDYDVYKRWLDYWTEEN